MAHTAPKTHKKRTEDILFCKCLTFPVVSPTDTVFMLATSRTE